MSVQRKFISVKCQGRALELSNLHIAQQPLASLLALFFLLAVYPQSLVAQAQLRPPLPRDILRLCQDAPNAMRQELLAAICK